MIHALFNLGLFFVFILYVASCHCVALDVEGRCYTWGRNEAWLDCAMRTIRYLFTTWSCVKTIPSLCRRGNLGTEIQFSVIDQQLFQNCRSTLYIFLWKWYIVFVGIVIGFHIFFGEFLEKFISQFCVSATLYINYLQGSWVLKVSASILSLVLVATAMSWSTPF